jgi:hypothetical protein
MTEGKLETAVQLRSEGHTLKETAQRLSGSVSSLTRALSQRGVRQRELRPDPGPGLIAVRLRGHRGLAVLGQDVGYTVKG